MSVATPTTQGMSIPSETPTRPPTPSKVVSVMNWERISFESHPRLAEYQFPRALRHTGQHDVMIQSPQPTRSGNGAWDGVEDALGAKRLAHQHEEHHDLEIIFLVGLGQARLDGFGDAFLSEPFDLGVTSCNSTASAEGRDLRRRWSQKTLGCGEGKNTRGGTSASISSSTSWPFRGSRIGWIGSHRPLQGNVCQAYGFPDDLVIGNSGSSNDSSITHTFAFSSRSRRLKTSP